MWPQYTWIALCFVGVGIHLAKDGEPRSNHSFWLMSLCAAFDLWLLYMGGFFKGM